MKFPVYRFPEVLRALRYESGLTVLQAAERTGYGNYERWESDETRVGPEYLRTIAEVFGIDGDLWLLAYAWLVDRYTPQPGAGFFDFTPQSIKRVLRRLPRGEVDLGEQGNLALRAMGHGQLAVMCLIARYGPAYAGADVPLVLPPTPRTPAPPADRSGYILARYTDVLGDLARYVSRTFLLATCRTRSASPYSGTSFFFSRSPSRWRCSRTLPGNPPPGSSGGSTASRRPPFSPSRSSLGWPSESSRTSAGWRRRRRAVR